MGAIQNETKLAWQILIQTSNIHRHAISKTTRGKSRYESISSERQRTLPIVRTQNSYWEFTLLTVTITNKSSFVARIKQGPVELHELLRLCLAYYIQGQAVSMNREPFDQVLRCLEFFFITDVGTGSEKQHQNVRTDCQTRALLSESVTFRVTKCSWIAGMIC